MITRRSFRFAAFACAVGLAGAACGGTSGGDTSSAPAPATEPAPVETDAAPADPAPTVPATGEPSSESSAVVPASLQFTAPLVGGGEIVGDELAGKPTAFWFWSPT